MKRVLAVVIVVAVCTVGFGFYRGWFALSSPSPIAGSNEVNINLATDTDKMKEDAQTVKDKATELTGNITDGSTEPAVLPTDEVQPNQESPDDGQP
ncbi:MAG: hypothetical protein AB7U20_18475 [Planctomycetaceae bacterium]